MTEYFGRVYELTVGEPGGESRTYDGFVNDPYQITFRIDQTPAAHLAYGEITIYGLSRESRKLIRERFTEVSLIAGWRTTYGTIFRGQIMNVETGREGADAFLKLYCRSAVARWDESEVNRRFAPGTSGETILRYVAQSFGYPVDLIGDFSDLPPALKGKTVEGDAKAVMDRLRASLKLVPAFEWYVDSNGRFQVVREGAERQDAQTYRYTPANGLIGTPEIKIDGIDVEVLLNPTIRPRDLYSVESETGALTFNSVYYKSFEFPQTTGEGLNQVIAIRHEGDYYGDTWQTDLEGVYVR